MLVLILFKTKMYNGICVGGITFGGEYVRLLDENGRFPANDTEYQIGQVWDINFRRPFNPRPLPHSEDVNVIDKEFKYNLENNIKMMEVLKDLNVKIHRGSIKGLFESKIQFTEYGTGYISEDNVSDNSVGFWIADQDITRNDYNGKEDINMMMELENLDIMLAMWE